jgi:hypothetical protein
MTSEKLKIILDSLVTKEERDFTVRISRRKTTRRMASHHSGHREIVIYNGQKSELTIQESLRILSLGLHELSHHIDHKNNKHRWYALWLSGRRRSLRARSCIKTLNTLIGRFNFHYNGYLKGMIVFNKRRPARPPTFELVQKT